MFQSVIMVRLPLVSAALVLYMKTAARSCVTDNPDNVIVEVFCILVRFYCWKLIITFTVTLCTNFKLVMLKEII